MNLSVSQGTTEGDKIKTFSITEIFLILSKNRCKASFILALFLALSAYNAVLLVKRWARLTFNQ